MAYGSNHTGCGWLIAIFLVTFIISNVRMGVEKLINGDIKLPKSGSSHVSGGSGDYGTSNGYNVNYKQPTSPNYNSSLRDYSETNSLPTKYEDGGSNNSYSTQSHTQYQNNSTTSTQSSSQSNQSTLMDELFPDNSSPTSLSIDVDELISNIEKQYTTCSDCNGKGYVIMSWTFYGTSGIICPDCWKSEKHEHVNEKHICYKCMGKGKVRIE